MSAADADDLLARGEKLVAGVDGRIECPAQIVPHVEQQRFDVLIGNFLQHRRKFIDRFATEVDDSQISDPPIGGQTKVPPAVFIAGVAQHTRRVDDCPQDGDQNERGIALVQNFELHRVTDLAANPPHQFDHRVARRALGVDGHDFVAGADSGPTGWRVRSWRIDDGQ